MTAEDDYEGFKRMLKALVATVESLDPRPSDFAIAAAMLDLSALIYRNAGRSEEAFVEAARYMYEGHATSVLKNRGFNN